MCVPLCVLFHLLGGGGWGWGVGGVVAPKLGLFLPTGVEMTKNQNKCFFLLLPMTNSKLLFCFFLSPVCCSGCQMSEGNRTEHTSISVCFFVCVFDIRPGVL